MKRFEVGKCYEVHDGCGCGYDERIWVETWQCIKINNGKATFNLVKYAISDYGSDVLKEKKFKPQKALCRLDDSEEYGYEHAHNYSQRLCIAACNEVKGE